MTDVRKIILTHPILGEIDRQVISGKYPKNKRIQDWRWRYGKKIDECEITIEARPSRQRIAVIETYSGEYYPSMQAATNATGVSGPVIALQLQGFKTPKTKLKFKRA